MASKAELLYGLRKLAGNLFFPSLKIVQENQRHLDIKSQCAILNIEVAWN